MKNYEITFIVRPDLDDEGLRAATQWVRDRIEAADGEILSHFPWGAGRRRLAYPINDFGDGYYYTVDFAVDSPKLRDFENALRLNDRILRFLVVQATDQMLKTAQTRMQQAFAPPPPPQPVVAPAGVPPATGAVPPTAPVIAGAPTPAAAETEPTLVGEAAPAPSEVSGSIGEATPTVAAPAEGTTEVPPIPAAPEAAGPATDTPPQIEEPAPVPEAAAPVEE